MTGSGALAWFTGLPSSGKTTLALRVRARLAQAGRAAGLLDSDELREVLDARSYAPEYEAPLSPEVIADSGLDDAAVAATIAAIQGSPVRHRGSPPQLGIADCCRCCCWLLRRRALPPLPLLLAASPVERFAAAGCFAHRALPPRLLAACRFARRALVALLLPLTSATTTTRPPLRYRRHCHRRRSPRSGASFAAVVGATPPAENRAGAHRYRRAPSRSATAARHSQLGLRCRARFAPAARPTPNLHEVARARAECAGTIMARVACMSCPGRILVVDDAANERAALAELLRDENYDVETAADAFKALGQCESFAPHVVITDLQMPGMDGIELVRKIRAADDATGILVMTAFAEVQTAIAAMRAGAADYLTKPLNFDELIVVLGKAIDNQAVRREARQLRARVRERVAPGNIIGTSPQMQHVFEVVDQVAPSRATVLITGESGTGKELVANALHQRSTRASGPFIKLHCAALAESLLESELFGHEKGSFAGAIARKDGRLQLADGGTLFLDEIAEISPAIQVKLLRFLQDREFERVGGTQTLRVDVRVIAATHRNLADEVARGRFRDDLYYRLNVVALEMPALRERKSDVPALARFFLDRYAKDNGKPVDAFSPEAMELLVTYDWPGNVRELENAVERAVVLVTGTQVEPRHLPPSVRPRLASAGMPAVPGATLRDLERYAILETLKATGGSTSKAADMLGISVRTIQYRLHQYNEAPRSEIDARKLADDAETGE